MSVEIWEFASHDWALTSWLMHRSCIELLVDKLEVLYLIGSLSKFDPKEHLSANLKETFT